jgi:hypothetical protein
MVTRLRLYDASISNKARANHKRRDNAYVCGPEAERHVDPIVGTRKLSC